jgi:hypothetical protein
MEQRGLWEHFPGEEITGTKTIEPPGTIHSSKDTESPNKRRKVNSKGN